MCCINKIQYKKSVVRVFIFFFFFGKEKKICKINSFTSNMFFPIYLLLLLLLLLTIIIILRLYLCFFPQHPPPHSIHHQNRQPKCFHQPKYFLWQCCVCVLTVCFQVMFWNLFIRRFGLLLLWQIF